MQRLPQGYNDFIEKNIEFLEFIVKPIADSPQNDAGRDAKLYINLGSISEDVIPDGRPNTEDGLSMTNLSPGDVPPGAWARQPRGTQNNIIDVAENRTEDVGLDGLVSYDPGSYDAFVREQEHFKGFLDAMDPSDPDPRYRAERAKALFDPSGDDYRYFEDRGFFDNREFFPEGATAQERLTRWFPATELNSYEGQNQLAPANYDIKRGNSRIPDSEDLNLNSAVDIANSYFEYEVPLSRTVLDSLATGHRAAVLDPVAHGRRDRPVVGLVDGDDCVADLDAGGRDRDGQAAAGPSRTCRSATR